MHYPANFHEGFYRNQESDLNVEYTDQYVRSPRSTSPMIWHVHTFIFVGQCIHCMYENRFVSVYVKNK